MRGWLKTFSERARPGAYLRVVSAGRVREGDVVHVVGRPAHDADVGSAFAR